MSANWRNSAPLNALENTDEPRSARHAMPRTREDILEECRQFNAKYGDLFDSMVASLPMTSAVLSMRNLFVGSTRRPLAHLIDIWKLPLRFGRCGKCFRQPAK
jgi:hypothetical protein